MKYISQLEILRQLKDDINNDNDNDTTKIKNKSICKKLIQIWNKKNNKLERIKNQLNQQNHYASQQYHKHCHVCRTKRKISMIESLKKLLFTMSCHYSR